MSLDETKLPLRNQIARIIEDDDGSDTSNDPYEFWYPIVDKIIALCAEDRVMVSHDEGGETTLHPVGQPCAKCRPPIAITDAMVERLQNNLGGANVGCCGHDDDEVRDALEAALNAD